MNGKFVLYIRDADSVNITGCYFDGISNSYLVMVRYTANFHLQHTSFTNNTATSHIVQVFSITNFYLQRTTFVNNIAGFGVVTADSTTNFLLQHSTFQHNRARKHVVIAWNTNSITITKCEFHGNIGKEGIVYIEPESKSSPLTNTTITRSTFIDNSAAKLSHAIYHIGHLTLRNVTVVSTNDVNSSLHQIVNQIGSFKADDVTLNIQKSDRRMVRNGYSYWQYAIMFGVLPIILIFPAAFGVSLNMMIFIFHHT